MSNSSLVSFTQISPNRTVMRNHEIDTITIHCVVGQASVEALGTLFAQPNKKASSNYGIGYDGRVGMYVEEKDRSWCSSNSENDNRAITIECASDTEHPYAINDKVYKTLIELCVDICKRNGIPELRWRADKGLIGQVDKQNMTVHRWFSNKSCPGEYIYSRLGQIASEVNRQLKVKSALYKVMVGTYQNYQYAAKMTQDLAKANYLSFVTEVDGVYYAQIGAYMNADLADTMAKNLRNDGFAAKILSDNAKPTPDKSIDELAKEVIQGLWGSGEERKAKLTQAGYDYDAVQKRVNEMIMGTDTTPDKSIDELAKEVIQGLWGSGEERKAKLTQAGYDYDAVQKRVNEMLG